jgi:hypothetical protein
VTKKPLQVALRLGCLWQEGGAGWATSHRRRNTVVSTAIKLPRIVLSLVSGCITGLVLMLLYLLSLSSSDVRWSRKFEQALTERGEIKPAELVTFKWNRIYFLQNDGEVINDDQNQLLSREYTQNYWTIAYTRDGQTPFFVNVDSWKWALGWHRLWTKDPNARLTLSPPGSAESTWCTNLMKHCLTLSDTESPGPVRPNR